MRRLTFLKCSADRSSRRTPGSLLKLAFLLALAPGFPNEPHAAAAPLAQNYTVSDSQ